MPDTRARFTQNREREWRLHAARGLVSQTPRQTEAVPGTGRSRWNEAADVNAYPLPELTILALGGGALPAGWAACARPVTALRAE